MLLSFKYKFLFIHIAKTGGTSIRDALKHCRRSDPYRIPLFISSKLSRFYGNRLGIKFPRHAKAIAALEMLPRDVYDSLFKFVVVRNPWDLQVSSYHHLKSERPHLVSHISDFEQFLRWKFDPERPYQFHADISAEQQTDYIVDLHGNVIVDYIARYETLAEDFADICRRVSLPGIRLPHKRRAEHRQSDYRAYYNDALAELVGDYYRRDIHLFGYSFEENHATGDIVRECFPGMVAAKLSD